MEMWRDRKAGRLWVSKEKYIEKVLHAFFVDQSKPVTTPLAAHFKLDRSTISGTNKEVKYMKTVLYSSVVGSLMYAMAIKWILRYLKGASNICLVYDGKGHGDGLVPLAMVGAFNLELEQLELKTTFFHGNLEERIYMSQPEGFNNYRRDQVWLLKKSLCAVSWKSTLQPTVALSTTKVKYMSMTEGIKECIWLHGLVQSLGLKEGEEPGVIL
nr:retrovirus-related Pol polyprotein from transposon TNT 1-94 [Tanacetum cinerariifolium]